MRVMRAMWTWVQLTASLLACSALCWLAVQGVFHLRLLNVQTGSMRPAFQPGDALVMQQGSPAKLQPGMIVAYRSSHSPNELITHRLIGITQNTFQTKGDALSAPDPRLHSSLLAGRVIAVLPGMGRVLGWFATWPGLVLCVYIPATAVATGELITFERFYRKTQRYRLSKVQVV